jgi:tetratricopeptide (TPR) repeat protein
LYEKAIFYFNKAIDLATEDHNYLRSRAQVYAYQGKFDLALADINKSIKGNSEDYRYYSDRAYYYCMMGDYDRAIIDTNKVIMLYPKHAEAFSTRGIAHWMKKMKEQAIEDMKSAMALVPDVSIRCALLGYFLHEQGQGAKAETYFSRAFGLYPNIIEYISKVGQLADAASIRDFYERVGTTAKIYKQKTPPARDDEMREEQVTGQDYVPKETSVLIESVKIIPGSVLPGGDFQIKVKCLVRDPGLEEKQVNIKFQYKIMKDEKSISEKTQDLSVPVGKPAILKSTLVAGKTPGVYNIQVMIFYKKKIAGDSASLEIK